MKAQENQSIVWEAAREFKRQQKRAKKTARMADLLAKAWGAGRS